MGVGAAIAGSAVLGAGASLFGSSKASSAASSAAAQQLQMYQTTRGDLFPYSQTGRERATGRAGYRKFRSHGQRSTITYLKPTPSSPAK